MSKIWTVRGVPDEVQREATQAAQEAGMKLGPWVERALRAALDGGAAPEGSQGRSAPTAGVNLVELERRLGVVETVLVELRQRATGKPPHAVEGVGVPAPTEADLGASGEAGETFVTGGGGTRRRLTATGIAEVERLIRAGVRDAEIAGRFGMDRGAIRQRRLKLERMEPDQSS